MDILTHTVSGLAAGSVVAGFSRKGFGNQAAIIALAGLGGALPDIDAVSLWSRFDATLGRFFGLSEPGKVIYSSTFWYSHHGFFHSLAAGLLFALLIGLLLYLLRPGAGSFRLKRFSASLANHKLLLTGFLAGFVVHLLGDLPTPAASWGGVRLFFPLESYVGGTGRIWWWNNYDLFLIALGVLLINFIFLAVRAASVRKITVCVFAAGFFLTLIHIHSRDYDFSYTGHTSRYNELEAESKAQQKAIFGERVFEVMEKFDNKLPFYF